VLEVKIGDYYCAVLWYWIGEDVFSVFRFLRGKGMVLGNEAGGLQERFVTGTATERERTVCRLMPGCEFRVGREPGPRDG